MLAAMQGNPTVFPSVHSPQTDCPTNDLRPSSNPVSVPTSIHYQNGPPPMIPVAMVPPPILVGSGTNYTVVPSLTGEESENMLGSLQFNRTAREVKAPIVPTAYFTNPEQQLLTAPSTSEENGRFITAVQPHPDSLPIDPSSHTHSDLSNHQLTTSPVELKQPFLLSAVSPASSSTGNALLERGASSSDPQLSEHRHHHHRSHGEGEEGHRRRRKKHSHRRRHHEIEHHPPGDPESETEGSPAKIIKGENDRTPSCSREAPNTADPTPTPHVSYPVQALVDIPMNPPLARSSRTSSLSSSLSSFRFGGSLSQLWASQVSLTTRLPNMKSTGNLNAETATMPSLGNQYFAFGGSLPELSLTSLSRLLPASGSSDTNVSSCPGFFTLLHPPLYVYPSQQHLTTPFINAHGSISFGSFLSGGSSLCSTQKTTPTSVESGEGSSEPAADEASSSIITRTENKVIEGSYSKLSDSSNSLSSNSGTKVSMFAPIPGPVIGHPQVLTALPAFHTITNNVECAMSHSDDVAAPIHSTSSQMVHPAGGSPPHIPAPNLETLACVATTPHHQLGSPVSPHPLPQHHMLHTSTGGGMHDQMQPHSLVDSKEGILSISGHYMNRPGVIQSSGPIPMSSIKLEREACIAPSPVKLSQGSPHAIPVISMPISECLRGEPPLHTITSSQPHTVTSLPEHPPQNITIETSPKREKDKPYKCDHPGCDRSFSFPAHLRSHVQQIHISYRPCKCEFPSCGKRFYTPQHLNVHKRVHTGERPFVCPYPDCGKAFTTAGNLKNHIRTHTGERPYSCKFDGCTKCFAEMSSLKKHELTHTGEKPYKCRVCGKAFSQAGSRNTHERKHSRTDEGEGEAGSKGPRRFRIKRITSSSDGTLIKTEPLL